MSETTSPSWARSPAALRAELVRRVEADLLGPLEGEEEVIRGNQRPDGTWWPPGRVRDRYLVGMLAPKGAVAADAERNDDAGREDGDAEPEAQGDRIAQRVLAQSSMGLTAVVDAGCDVLLARCRWGQYVREFEDHPDGSRAAVWRREPQNVEVRIGLKEGEFGPLPVNADGVVLRGRIAATGSGPWLVTVFLVNEQAQVKTNKDARWLFQARLELAAPDGQAVFLGREAVLPSAPGVAGSEQVEVQRLEMQYRDQVEFAVGHGVGVAWERVRGTRRATLVATSVLPRYEVWRTEAPDDLAELAGLVTDMKALAELEPDGLRAALSPLVDGYEAWLDAEAARVAGPEFAGHVDAAQGALAEARAVSAGVRRGIDLVCSDGDALDAFRFANEAMRRQRVHTVAIGHRRDDPDLSLREAVVMADIASNRSWRPFQLAFVLLCLPSLTDPAHPERRAGTSLADLLFFPTGGGKTEAYLGLVAFTLAIRRLQGVVGVGDDAVDGRDGVAVLMRYTLRLLTAQQFQRAATLICAAELLRRRRVETDARWAGVPFRLGMWVGGAVTPNSDKDARQWVEQQRQGGRGSSRFIAPLQLSDCPWCGRALDPAADCTYDSRTQRFLIYCGDHEECAFTQFHAPGEGIPVVTVDSQVYRLLPSFVIATLDKFAQLPWNGALSSLFGQVDSRCERHGYRNADLDRSHASDWPESNSHPPRDGLPAASTVDVSPRLRPPDLILQDEMHLVSGPLGTMTGLYETAIDRLTTWRFAGEPVRPKVVASTATIRRAEQQTWAVFWRRLRVFPSPVLDARRSFFAEQVEPSDAAPGRLHLGVCARGERLKQVELRVFATLMAAAQAMYDELGDSGGLVDPWMTTIGYFNAVRELAGMRRMAEDELRTKLRRTRFTAGLANRPTVNLEELTSRVSSDEIRGILRQLFVTHDPTRSPDSDAGRPVDLLLATSMISVGVDVPRFGSMVVVGQPKATAEYIQATSRVGRSAGAPGLVVTIYNWAKPRDLSHYETFGHYHATLYRHIEPLSVTPFSERALDKGLTGVLVAAVRHHDADWNPNQSARRLERSDERIAAHVHAVSERAAAVSGATGTGDLVRAMLDRRLDSWDRKTSLLPDLSYVQRASDDVPLLSRPEARDWTDWTCPNSLRDTEVQINLQIATEDPTYETGGRPDFRLGLPDPGEQRPSSETTADEDIAEAMGAAEGLEAAEAREGLR